MKLIKIGSSPSCDIVLQSPYVSNLHIEMTLLDNGDIIIVDKDSTNGTFVGSRRISPNKEVTVRRGDYIRLGNEELKWARIPVLEKLDNYKCIVNIGSNYRNDVIINSEVVSRFHATLRIDKKGKAFIVDNHSKNGTTLNGIRLQPNVPVRIKRGDSIVCGTENVTERLAEYLPSAFPLWAKITSAVAAVAALFVIIFGIAKFASFGNNGDMDIKSAQKAVVYVRASFRYVVTIENNPFTDKAQKELLVKVTPGIPYQATAFFVDKEGRMATNRHVAKPWDEMYRGDGVTEKLREEYQKFLLAELNVQSWEFFVLPPVYILKKLKTSELGRAILDNSENMADVIAKINIIQNSKIVISGEMNDITVGYAGQYYTHEDQFQRCYVLAESKDADADIALLQLNNKKTPEGIDKVFDIKSIPDEELEPQKDKMYVVGYPYGILWGQDEKSKSLEPNVKETKCSKIPGKYNFEFQESSIGGSSGSPVFTDKGNLVGILTGGISGQTISLAVKAKYLKKLYEEEVVPVK